MSVLFLLLGLVYNVTIPLWEADHEWSHYRYVRHILDQRTLPRLEEDIVLPTSTDQCEAGQAILFGEARHQYRQPPLYYLLGAAVTVGIDTSSPLPISANPYRLVDPSRLGHNFLLHTAAEAFPYQGHVLAVHVLRGLSSILGLLGIVAAYLIGLLLFPGRRLLATAVMAINAFIPQYLFASATVNNDVLVGALGAWCLFFSLRAIRYAPSLRDLLLAGLLAGLVALSKYNGLTLLVPVGVALLYTLVSSAPETDSNRPRIVLWSTGILLVSLLPILFWFGRNWVLYDQLLADYPSLNYILGNGLPGLLQRLSLDRLAATSQFMFVSFWGHFGWETISLPHPVLLLLAAVSLLALTGVVIYLADRSIWRVQRALVVTTLLFLLVVLIASFFKGSADSEPRGRYLMPAYGAISLLLVLGLDRILPERVARLAVVVFTLGMFILAAAVPPLVIRPAYATPELVSSVELQPGEEPVYANIGGLAELLGYRIEPADTVQGEEFLVTLVWRVLKATPNNYTVSLHLVDHELVPRAQVSSHPANGNYPTSRWQPGDVFRDSYTLYWSEEPWEELPTVARIKLAVVCVGKADDGTQYLDVTDQEDSSLGDAVYFGQFKVSPEGTAPEQPDPSEVRYVFGDTIGLSSVEVVSDTFYRGQPMLIRFEWLSLGVPPKDYTVFAHLVNQDGEQVAGFDEPLTGGRYPSSFWAAGERIAHDHTFRLPMDLAPGSYALRAGLYDLDSGARPPLRDALGNEQTYIEIPLGTVVADRDLFVPGVQVDKR